MFDTPILFLIFNRPELTSITFSRIREIKPKYLFVSADGPRHNVFADIEKCNITRRIVKENIDWDCKITYYFNQNNLGCGLAVSSAISWFFDHVDFGIILEDDCLPNISFFSFCSNLLNKYNFNNKITHIGGHNCQMGYKRGYADYYFSRFTHIWGWATWKRAWKNYNFNDIDLDLILTHPYNKIFPSKLLKDFIENKVDTWDIQWHYCNFINNNYAIIPNINLVDNIGFHSEATHTSFKKPGYFNKNHSCEISNNLVHPSKIIFNNIADEFTATYRTNLYKPSLKLKLYNRISHRFIN
jgi:hypothetical protein